MTGLSPDVWCRALGWFGAATVDALHAAAPQRGAVVGVVRYLSQAADGTTAITDISVGTNVGNGRYYLDRPRATNDFHGLGTFLYLNEQPAGAGR
ncbi:hypothetical protein OHS18_08365 [Amycolatopsis sp. NBC_00355]|uniref:hypothetical protein n=1 Tax=Amycolatopsis sp. NBC_00355 TaxID=2975957 RepID=UPI002E26927D